MLCGAIAAMAALVLAAAPALAQTELSPPKPGRVDNPPVVMSILVLLIMVAMLVGAFVIPSKRGHQD